MIAFDHPDRMVRDLSKHFEGQVSRLITDTIDTCDRAGISHSDCAKLTVASLVNAVVVFTHLSGGRESELIELIRLVFQKVREREQRWQQR